MNSREKGKRGERLWRDVLRAEGFAAERGVQYKGGRESPDVHCPDLPDIHWEVKFTSGGEKVRVWMEQAIKDADDLIPIVAHKRNGMEWLCTMRAEDLLYIVKEAL